MKTALLIAVSLMAASTVEAQSRTRVGRLAQVTFESGSAQIPVKQRERIQLELGRVAAWALDNPDGVVVVDGHADARGSRSANVRLSLQRAKHVRDQLVAAGVDPDQIVIAAMGERGEKRRVVVWGTRSGVGAVTRERVTIR